MLLLKSMIIIKYFKTRAEALESQRRDNICMCSQKVGSSTGEEIDPSEHPCQNTQLMSSRSMDLLEQTQARGQLKAGEVTAPDEPFHLVLMLPSST